MFIIKVPGINGLKKTLGCEESGNAILKALYEIHSNEQGKEINVKNLDLEEIHLNNSNLELTNELIYKNSFETFEEHPKSVFLGGDHSISYSITRAFFDYCENRGKEPCLIVFDAHPDLMKPIDSDSEKTPTHEEWLRGLIEDGFPVKNILLIGIRNSDPEEIRFIKEKGIRTISINQLNENLEEVTDIITEFANEKELYVSIDIDVLDPAFAPSTGYLEPGGLTSRQFLYILQRINKIKNLRAVDIVEINREKDKENNNMTIKLGAKILSELI